MYRILNTLLQLYFFLDIFKNVTIYNLYMFKTFTVHSSKTFEKFHMKMVFHLYVLFYDQLSCSFGKRSLYKYNMHRASHPNAFFYAQPSCYWYYISNHKSHIYMTFHLYEFAYDFLSRCVFLMPFYTYYTHIFSPPMSLFMVSLGTILSKSLFTYIKLIGLSTCMNQSMSFSSLTLVCFKGFSK